jgi:hypothetical protein
MIYTQPLTPPSQEGREKIRKTDYWAAVTLPSSPFFRYNPPPTAKGGREGVGKIEPTQAEH